MKTKSIISWLLRIIAAVIRLPTFFFKFSGSEESVYIFSTLEMKPLGRIGSGIAELMASILLLWPGTTGLGALFGVGIMAGTLLAHLPVPGISVQGDNGYLFYLGITVFTSCILLLLMYLSQIQKHIGCLTGKRTKEGYLMEK